MMMDIKQVFVKVVVMLMRQSGIAFALKTYATS